jgi:hypothetical protein
VLKWLSLAFGVVSLVGGAVTFWLPLPLGVPLLLLGTALLTHHSPHARRALGLLIRRYPRALGFLSPLLRRR